MPNEMTFQQEGDYIVCYIDGVEVSRAKKAADGTSTAEVIDIINDQIKANPTLSGTEPDLTGLEVSGDKYAVPAQIPVVANPTLAGTEADLTGLEVDGVKYAVPQGGSEVHLYGHFISAKPSATSIVNFVIYSNNNVSFTSSTAKQWLKDNGFSVILDNSYVASGFSTTGNVIIGVGVAGSYIEISSEYINNSNALVHDTQNYISFSSLTDTIIQIF